MEPIECFGYTADILTGSFETLEATVQKLVRVSHKRQHTTDLWVDRFDVQLLLDDPTVLWDNAIDITPASSGSPSAALVNEDTLLDKILDAERYHDLIPESLIHYSDDNTPDFLVLPGPTHTTIARHVGVPTAEEYALSDRNLNKNDYGVSSEPKHEYRQIKKQDDITSNSLLNNNTHQQHIKKRRTMFKPELAGLVPNFMAEFMEEVKSRQASTALPVWSFWPSSLAEHLCIEKTASIVNSLGPTADLELKDFASTLCNPSDRVALGFINKWHSLHPYYTLIKQSRYRHAEYLPTSIPIELRSLFQPKKSDILRLDSDPLSSESTFQTSTEILRNHTNEESVMKDLTIVSQEIKDKKDPLLDVLADYYEEELNSFNNESSDSTYATTSEILQSGTITDHVPSCGVIIGAPVAHLKPSEKLKDIKRPPVLVNDIDAFIPNLGWDDPPLSEHELLSNRASRIIREIGFELFRLKETDSIKKALNMMKSPQEAPLQFLSFTEDEWSYLKHILITVFLQCQRTPTAHSPLIHSLHPSTIRVLDLLRTLCNNEQENVKKQISLDKPYK